MIATFGALPWSLLVNWRPATSGIPITSKKFARDDDAVDADEAAEIRIAARRLDAPLHEHAGRVDAARQQRWNESVAARTPGTARRRSTPRSKKRVLYSASYSVDSGRADEHQVIGVVPQIDMPQIIECPQKEAGADEKHERDGHLGDQKSAAE